MGEGLLDYKALELQKEGRSLEEVAQWVEENNFQMQGPMFNIYHVSPAMDQNPDNWVTEVCVPLNAE